MAEAQKKMNDPATQAQMKEMQEKMNDPEFKAMMESNPQLKAQMEAAMKMMQGGDAEQHDAIEDGPKDKKRKCGDARWME